MSINFHADGQTSLRTFMETDAKGQLGGIECNDDQRRRLAKESHAWKCSTCLKSNADILKECVEAAKEHGSQVETEVPKELKMGFKDEMSSSKPDTDRNEDDESTELAEGFVQTVPTPNVGATEAAIVSPTATVIPPIQARLQTPSAVQARAMSNEGVPAWVDRAIIAVIACLIALILRLMMGY